MERKVARLKGMRYIIHDRDTKHSLRFRIVVEDAGITPIKTPFQAPNANAYAERNRQGIGNELIDCEVSTVGEITSRERLGGLRCYYHRAA